jgi:hypothetical protein
MTWWDLTYREDPLAEAPHVEDVIFVHKSPASPPKGVTIRHIAGQALHWRGDSRTLFDGGLGWTGNGSGYVSRRGAMPSGSVGFWRPDSQLDFDGKRYIEAKTGHRLAYVGLDDPVAQIPANALIRVSLARWWSGDADFEERCYLQLSCWYPGL